MLENMKIKLADWSEFRNSQQLDVIFKAAQLRSNFERFTLPDLVWNRLVRQGRSPNSPSYKIILFLRKQNKVGFPTCWGLQTCRRLRLPCLHARTSEKLGHWDNSFQITGSPPPQFERNCLETPLLPSRQLNISLGHRLQGAAQVREIQSDSKEVFMKIFCFLPRNFSCLVRQHIQFEPLSKSMIFLLGEKFAQFAQLITL